MSAPTEERTECQKMADDILKRITWYPESYDQRTWQTVGQKLLRKLMPKGGSSRKLQQELKAKGAPTLANCQTTGCIAGTASILAGDVPDIHLNEDSHWAGSTLQASSVLDENGRAHSIQDRGAKLLCLSMSEQEWLFAASRTVLEVVHALREISAGKRISRLSQHSMSAEQRKEIQEFRQGLRQQKPRVNYVARNLDNKLFPYAEVQRAKEWKAQKS